MYIYLKDQAKFCFNRLSRRTKLFFVSIVQYKSLQEIGVGFRLGLGLELSSEGQFYSGAIVLEPNKYYINF